MALLLSLLLVCRHCIVGWVVQSTSWSICWFIIHKTIIRRMREPMQKPNTRTTEIESRETGKAVKRNIHVRALCIPIIPRTHTTHTNHGPYIRNPMNEHTGHADEINITIISTVKIHHQIVPR